MRIRHQEIRPERLSMARLQRENAAVGLGEFDVSSNIYPEFGFPRPELPDVIQTLAPPPGFRTIGEAGTKGICAKSRTSLWPVNHVGRFEPNRSRLPDS